jgi:hypothetical protein
MSRFAQYTSITANLVFAAFLGCLIYNQARTLRWVHTLNPLWFVLVAVAAIVFIAILTEWQSRRAKRHGRGEAKSGEAGSHEGGSDPAKSPAGPGEGGQQPSPAQAAQGATT